MKRFPVVALLVIGLAIPVCAQRSGGRGGFSGHSAPAFRGGGFTAPASVSAPHFTGAPHYTGQTSRPGAGVPYNSGTHPAYGNNRNHWSYTTRYRNGIPYLSAVWAGPGLWGYPDSIPYDNSYAPPDDTAGYDAPPPPAPDQPLAPPPYPTWPAPAPASTDIAPEEAVTLVFRDGRPTEQIHNYIMTRTTLYIRDEHRQEIPLISSTLPQRKR